MQIALPDFVSLEILLLSVSTAIVLGHNFWLTASRSIDYLRIEAHVGHHFPVGESAVAPERVADYQVFTSHGAMRVEGVYTEGSALVAEIPLDKAEAYLAAIVLHPRLIELEADSFAGYIDEEDAEAFVSPHFRPGETMAAQREIYSKYAKVILSSGDDESICRAVGHKMEIVPDRNPAAFRCPDRLGVCVLLDGKPISGVRVSSGCDRLGAGYAAHVRTDDEGRAEVELPIGGEWFIRSHLIRRLVDEAQADPVPAEWESFWPSLTFRVNDE